MASTERLKARLLQEAVEDNIATINGRPRRVGCAVNLWSRRSTLLILFLAILGDHQMAARWGNATATAGAAQLSANIVSFRPPVVTTSFDRPQPVSPAELALDVRRVVIDAGHGGTSVGTSATGGLREKDVTLNIAERLRQLLVENNFVVLMTREGDETMSLQERSEMANRGRGDIFLSIHLNALRPDSRGVETYYLGPTAAPAVNSVVAEENRDSGYSLSDMRTLLDQIYIDTRADESRHFAESVQRALVRGLRRVNPALEDRGVKTAPFLVLAATQMPAILAEVSCLSNDDETKLLIGSEYRQTIANALFDGIRAYLGDRAPRERKETDSGS